MSAPAVPPYPFSAIVGHDRLRLALLLCAGCDSRDPPTSDEPKVTEEELVLSAKAQDCVTEHVRQHFSATATDDEHARAAVLACEAGILRFERIRGLETAAPGPDLSQLLAERSASSPSRDRLRAHRLRRISPKTQASTTTRPRLRP